MKALKYIFILLLVVIIAGAIYFSLQDGHYDVSRSAVVEAPKSLVYEQLADLKKWENWDAYRNEEDMEVTYRDQTAGVDGAYSFTDEYGTGTITITKLDPNKSMEMDFVYEHSMGKSEAQIDYQLVEVEDGTQVTMHVEGDQTLVDKIFNKVTGTDMEQELGDIYDESLVNLDTYLQEKMDQYTISPDGLIDYGGGYYLYMSTSSTMENFTRLQTQMLQKIRSYMSSNNIDSYGAPMVIYEKFDETRENVIFSAGIPVKDRVITAVNSTILCGFQEPGRAVKITLKGDYKYLPEAWQIGEGFITVNGLERSEQPPFEFYKTDSYKEANPANYLTEVYLPVL
ncbi:effector-binding domain-containing protein [Nonlabens sp. Hel1_33_55]|uniref:SRPBCC family protein n=1 Tax=Nonlabens sp. Hel1_33_55 TaxID=1336802 RepID=UPI000875D132|nr:SRPBCC family protein [Nonlabens sp. Hel1_33_55]SCX96698.1 effector-binding domain-containing protein [Nonlabens sp. Hel1_33_55]